MSGYATEKHTAGYADNETHLDVLIIGAGISGVNAAYRVQTELPNSSYAILEGRHELGGTWSQFTYPGVRSDSDLHTLGFKFNPWEARNPIATGDNILSYLRETVQKFDIEERIRYNQKVASANWSSEQQRWQVQVDMGRGEKKERVVYWVKWMILGTGRIFRDWRTISRAKRCILNSGPRIWTTRARRLWSLAVVQRPSHYFLHLSRAV
jgi:cation diffusion facilitator CzcD-associated flavoprotein CzcO